MTAPNEALLPGEQNETLQLYEERSLLALLVCISVTGPIVTGGVYFRDGPGPLMAVGVVLTVLVWLLLLMFRTGQRHRVASLLVYLLVATSAAAIAAHGTVRSMASLVMLAAVVGAGTFLNRASMVICASLAIILLAILNVAENLGYLPTPQTKTGWAVWVTQTMVLISLVVTVNYGRRRLLEAFQEQLRALALAREAASNLASSEARFRALFGTNPAASVVHTMEQTTITDVNEAFLTLFGYRREELVSVEMPALWADQQALQTFQTNLRESGRVTRLQTQGLRKNGTQFDALVFSELMAHGDEKLVVTMVQDISAEKDSLRELEKSQERFTKAFNFSPLGMTITRLSDGRFVEANTANERVLGYTPEDFLGNSSLQSVWLNQADRNHYINTLQTHGELTAYETRMRTKRGEIADVKVWAEIIEIDGAPCALSYTLNITEEKRREALLVQMAEGVSGQTGEPFFRSLAVHMAQALKAGLVIVGEISHPEFVQTLSVCFEGESVPNFRYALEGTPCQHAMAIHGGESYFTDQLRAHFPSDQFPIGSGFESYAGVALRDADGTPIGILKAVWTEQRAMTPNLRALLTIFSSRCNAELIRLRRDREIEQLQATLEQRVKARTAQLEYANRELDTFAYSVSHDLKSPLRSIDGFLHILQEQMGERMTAADDDIFQKISASASRMGSLIADMLSLARVSQGKLQRMNVNLNELIDSVIRQERDRDPTHTVEIAIAPSLFADCDPRMAQIVLENLIGNAWKYSHKNSHPRIEIGQRQADSAGASTFFIQDNGAGFDMARADRLFRPFTRLHTHQEFEGSGIGLATVRRIVERHGGFVRAQGEVGSGACFEFSFGNDTAD